MGSYRVSRFCSTNEQFSMRLDVSYITVVNRYLKNMPACLPKFSEPDRVHLVDTGNESVFDDCSNCERLYQLQMFRLVFIQWLISAYLRCIVSSYRAKIRSR